MLICPALPSDAADIDRLLDAAFGPGRHQRTASKLRMDAVPIAGPSLVARCDGTDDLTPCESGALLGSIQFWPIALVASESTLTNGPPSRLREGSGVGMSVAAPPPAFPPPDPLPHAGGGVALTLLGPVAVAASARSIGLGRKLIAAALAVADRDGLDLILLIGDFSYYGRFGFTADATGGWSLPGPVERERLLLRQRVPRPLPASALVVPAAASAALLELVAADG